MIEPDRCPVCGSIDCTQIRVRQDLIKSQSKGGMVNFEKY